MQRNAGKPSPLTAGGGAANTDGVVTREIRVSTLPSELDFLDQTHTNIFSYQSALQSPIGGQTISIPSEDL